MFWSRHTATEQGARHVCTTGTPRQVCTTSLHKCALGVCTSVHDKSALPLCPQTTRPCPPPKRAPTSRMQRHTLDHWMSMTEDSGSDSTNDTPRERHSLSHSCPPHSHTPRIRTHAAPESLWPCLTQDDSPGSGCDTAPQRVARPPVECTSELHPLRGNGIARRCRRWTGCEQMMDGL